EEIDELEREKKDLEIELEELKEIVWVIVVLFLLTKENASNLLSLIQNKGNIAEIFESEELYSFWKNTLRDQSWYPFKTIEVRGKKE
ncbi:hypothetical protein MKX03_020248, partial [Papaver bracteatum]